jgi:hypothetical protein
MLTLDNSVQSYTPASATLLLHHRCPIDSRVEAVVDIRLLLETMRTENTQVGEWVNVLGYVTTPPVPKDCVQHPDGSRQVWVRAVLLWSTGPLKIDEYESHLESQNIGTKAS